MPVARPTKQSLEWAAAAAELKAQGYNRWVIARKMIQVHGMPEDAAEALVGELFGVKKVSARPGESVGVMYRGMAAFVGSLLAVMTVFTTMGVSPMLVPVYLVSLGFGLRGLVKAFIAWVNIDAKEDLRDPHLRHITVQRPDDEVADTDPEAPVVTEQETHGESAHRGPGAWSRRQ